MALKVSMTNDCKKLLIKVLNSQSGVNNELKITNGSYSTSLDFPGGQVTYTTLVLTSTIGTDVGVFHIQHLEDGNMVSHAAVVAPCDVLCCLAKKIDELLDCNCDCSKCATQLAEAQKIFLLLQSAKSAVELASVNTDNSGYYSDILSKYKKAREICDNSCGCDC